MGHSFEETRARLVAHDDCPPTQVAAIGQSPVGVVGFRRFPQPGEGTPGLWIDVLYVDHAFRGRGIASELVSHAERLASAYEHVLFVYTASPQFYSHLQWTPITEADTAGCVVLRRELPFAIDEDLVARLLASQFPDWAGLPIRRVLPGGWDNRTFRLGADMLVRIPSGAAYAASVAREQRWLPYLAERLPLRIPEPLAMGMPDCGLAWNWSVYHWLEGDAVTDAGVGDPNALATDLAHFLNALLRVECTDGPLAGPENFFRGGDLSVYDGEVRSAMDKLSSRIDVPAATAIWELALDSAWQRPPVWVHGDISAGNLLLADGVLSAVIDFGQLAIGDPACDLAIAWSLFDGRTRERFLRELEHDEACRLRGRGWALWKALIVAAGLPGTNPAATGCNWNVLEDIIGEHKH